MGDKVSLKPGESVPITDNSPELDSFRAFASRYGVRLVVTSSPKPAFMPGHDKIMFVPSRYTAAQRGNLAADMIDMLDVTKSGVA